MTFNRIASTGCKESSLSSSTAGKEAKPTFIIQDQVSIKQSVSNHKNENEQQNAVPLLQDPCNQYRHH